MTVTIDGVRPDAASPAGDTESPGVIPVRAQVGIGLVAAGAAVLSFSALRGLAISTGTWSWIAFLLPVSLDAAAGVAMFVWMRASDLRVVRYARGLTWASILVSIVCNGANHGFSASGLVPPWQAAVAVGAIPPIMFGAVIHLAFLSRQPARWGGPEAVTLTDESGSTNASALQLAEAVEDDGPTVTQAEAPDLPVTDTKPSPPTEAKPWRRRCGNHGCGKLLPPGSRTDRRFCDATCRQAASRARHASSDPAPVTDDRTSEVPA